MNKFFKLNIKDKSFTLCFNMICTEQLGKLLKCDPMPDAIKDGLISMNERSSFLMYKCIIYAGILGNDYISSFEPSVTQEEVGQLIVECSADQLKDLFETLTTELGYNLNLEVLGDEKAVDSKKKA